MKAFEDVKSAKKVIAASIERYLEKNPDVKFMKDAKETVEGIKKAISDATK